MFLFIFILLPLIYLLQRLHKDYKILSLCRRFKTLDGSPLEETVAIAKGSTIFDNSFDIINITREQLFEYSRNFARTLKRNYVQYIFGLPVYNVIDAVGVEHILNDNNLITKGEIYGFLEPFLKTGLLTSTAQKWHGRRKLLTPAYHFKILEQFLEIFKQESTKFVQVLQKLVAPDNDGSVINLDELIPRFTLNSICETALGVKLDECLDGDEYRENIKVAEGSFIKRVMNPLWISDVLYNTFGDGRKDNKTLEKLHAFSSGIIKKRRQHFVDETANIVRDTSANGLYAKERYAMLDTLLLAEKYGLIDHEGICEEVDTFMFEGFDTTSMCLIFSLLNLANHTLVQQRCYEEITQLIHDDLNNVSQRDLNQLKYLDCVVKETLRLYPSVPNIVRKCNEDTKLPNNLLLPKGTQINIHIFDIQRNEKYFDRPNEFIPQRFLNESLSKHPFAFVPFSAGRRNCIGQKFALTEIKTLLVYILLHFELSPITKPESLRFLSGILIRTHADVFVKFNKRNKLSN